MTRLFLDTEFLDRPYPAAPELLSIGIVDDEANEYYAINRLVLDREVEANEWVRENVWPFIKDAKVFSTDPVSMALCIKAHWPKADEVWAYCGTWDWYLIVQRVFGGYMQIPEGWPSYFHELAALKRSHKCEDCPVIERAHHALYDAQWNRAMYHHLVSIGK